MEWNALSETAIRESRSMDFRVMNCWNDFLYAMVFIPHDNSKPIPVGLTGLLLDDVYVRGELMDMFVQASILIYIVGQRGVVGGFVAGGVKASAFCTSLTLGLRGIGFSVNGEKTACRCLRLNQARFAKRLVVQNPLGMKDRKVQRRRTSRDQFREISADGRGLLKTVAGKSVG
jgi:hypothetical protein